MSHFENGGESSSGLESTFSRLSVVWKSKVPTQAANHLVTSGREWVHDTPPIFN